MRRIHPGLLALLVSVAVIGGLSYALIRQTAPKDLSPSSAPIVVHVAEALRGPMEPIAKQYEGERGQKIELRYGPSQTILSQMILSKQGDLFVPADDSYIEDAKKKGVTAEVLPLASMSAVLATRPGFPKAKSWDEVLRPGVKWVIANPEAAAISKVARQSLTKSGHWDKIQELKPTMHGTVNQVAQAVSLGAADVGIIWDAVAQQFPKATLARLPELDGATGQIRVVVTTFSKNPQNALDFAKYLAAADKGQVEFEKHGFRTSAVADTMAERPEILLHAGSMLRPAIEPTLVEFEEREHCRITRVYNGCGILVAQMKAGDRPDLYFACDTQFMKQVQELFEPAAVLSSNQLVIAVPKGNPFEVASLKDLGKTELKLGVGHEQQCALGSLTQATFLKSGLVARLARNIKVQSPTGDLLVNQLRTGALDAVVCYQSNVAPYEKELEAIAIDIQESSCTQPEQPIAVSKTTRHPQLVSRLIQTLQTAESKKRFLDLGFTWKAAP
ncbi:MAG: molybdate ABC transporter substrate-binding protein [Gemmataceae bacterium]|nr:molybdate ABC transporter substrate-binding protein [Gemmataceae bacterium]